MPKEKIPVRVRFDDLDDQEKPDKKERGRQRKQERELKAKAREEAGFSLAQNESPEETTDLKEAEETMPAAESEQVRVAGNIDDIAGQIDRNVPVNDPEIDPEPAMTIVPDQVKDLSDQKEEPAAKDNAPADRKEKKAAARSSRAKNPNKISQDDQGAKTPIKFTEEEVDGLIGTIFGEKLRGEMKQYELELFYELKKLYSRFEKETGMGAQEFIGRVNEWRKFWEEDPAHLDTVKDLKILVDEGRELVQRKKKEAGLRRQYLEVFKHPLTKADHDYLDQVEAWAEAGKNHRALDELMARAQAILGAKTEGPEITSVKIDAEPVMAELPETYATEKMAGVFDEEEMVNAWRFAMLRDKDIAVHGRLNADRETGKATLIGAPDIDGLASITILRKLAKNNNQIEYVAPGDRRIGKINIDTGNNDKVVYDGDTVYADHHAPDSPRGSSSAKYLFEELDRLGFLDSKEKEAWSGFIEFVTKCDNADYEIGPDYFRNFHQTLYGLRHKISEENMDKVLEFFRKGGDPAAVLSREELDGLGLSEASKEAGSTINYSKNELERMEKNGLIIESGEYGRIAIDINKKVGAGADAARAKGCDSYLIWNSELNSFFISSVRDLRFDLDGAKKIRGRMMIRPLDSEDGQTHSLGAILKKMGASIDLNEKNELSFYLRQEKMAAEIRSAEEAGGKPDQKTMDRYFINHYRFLKSKYTGKNLELRERMISLRDEAKEKGYENDKLKENIDQILKRANSSAKQKVDLFIRGMSLDQASASKVKDAILGEWENNSPAIRHLMAEDIELMIDQAILKWKRGALAKSWVHSEDKEESEAIVRAISERL
jgi:hypothetical protein